MRRVAVTGLGAISALGVGVPAFWDGIVNGRSGVRRITHFDPSGYLTQVAAEIPVFDPSPYFEESTSPYSIRSRSWRWSPPTKRAAMRGSS